MTNVLILFSVIFLLWEVSLIVGFHGVALIMDISLDNYTLNPFDNEIMNNYDTNEETPYVACVPWALSVFFKYFIKDHGLVFRFTKLAKKIDAKFKELENANSNA